MNPENIKIAYGIANSSNTNGYLGAVLVTDYKGFPLEFRYTDPIIPTKIQQVLYGKGLEKYIKIDVIADSLLRIIANKVSLFLVHDEDLLNYKTGSVVIIRVSSTKAPPLSEVGDISKVKDSEYLLQISHAHHPVRLQFSPYFSCESEQFDSIIECLKQAGEYMDIEEPIHRVQKTLELICNQEI